MEKESLTASLLLPLISLSTVTWTIWHQRLGFSWWITATAAKRDDALTGLMTAHLGPVLHKVPVEQVYQGFSAKRPLLIKRPTRFDFDYRENYGEMVTALSQDEERNRLIVSDILAETAEEAARAIVVCERREHLERLRKMLELDYRMADVVSALTRPGELERIVNRFERGKLQVICVTVKSLHLIKVDRITHLFMASPVAYGEYVAQAVGKVLWAKGEKPARIFDYVDRPLVLEEGLKKRLKIYGGMGVWIGN